MTVEEILEIRAIGAEPRDKGRACYYCTSAEGEERCAGCVEWSNFEATEESKKERWDE